MIMLDMQLFDHHSNPYSNSESYRGQFQVTTFCMLFFRTQFFLVKLHSQAGIAICVLQFDNLQLAEEDVFCFIIFLSIVCEN